MTRQGARRSRSLLVWLHVVTSVGWMSQALALFVLLVAGVTARDATIRLGAYQMAALIDERLLLHMANTSAFSGLMLCALTPWGYFRYWWVLGKFAITLSQLYLGIFILSPRLAAAVAAAEHGRAVPVDGFVAAPLLMGTAIAVQAWLSVAKPWKRTPWADRPAARRHRPVAGPAWMFGFCVAVPLTEYVLAVFVLGHPFPLVSLLTAIGYPLWRARTRPPAGGSPGNPVAHLAR